MQADQQNHFISVLVKNHPSPSNKKKSFMVATIIVHAIFML